MRLLLDMGVSPRTADFLRQRSYDAVHLWEERLERLSDAEIVTKAARERRAIITFDLDFPRIVALSRLANPSLVCSASGSTPPTPSMACSWRFCGATASGSITPQSWWSSPIAFG